MAGPIKIAILADAASAIKSVTKFSEVVDSETKRVVTTLGDSKLQGGFGKVQEGFDVMDTRAMGFRDTLTGIQDTQRGFAALTTSTAEATANVAEKQKAYNDAVRQYGRDSAQATEAQSALAMAQEDLGRQQAPLIDKMFLLGTGVGDLASGFANFIVPMAAVVTTMNGLSLASARATIATGAQKVAMVAGTVATGALTAAQWLLNVALTANPIGLVILAVVGLVAAVVIAYRRSETFRRIVQGAFAAVQRAASAAWNWVKANWPLLLAIITGPIGLAVRWVTQNFDKISAKVRGIPGVIRGAFAGAGSWLRDAGRRIIDGLLSSVQAGFDRVRRKFQQLTNLIPSWKGPAARDRNLLKKPADLIMTGFTDQLESRFSGVRSTLNGFTGGLATAAAGGATSGRAAAAPAAGGSGQMRLVADAGTGEAGRLLVALLAEATRKGGGLRAMGVVA
jgi:phage-related protein